MTTLPMHAAPATRSAQRSLRAAVAAALIMAFGTVALYATSYLMGWVLQKTPTPLPNPQGLAALTKRIGFYRAIGNDRYLEPHMVQALGAKSYLLRDYGDDTKRSDDPGSILAMNLNYYDTGSASPHVPDICWVGSGRVKIRDEQMIVKGVPHLKGEPTDLPMRLLSFAPQAGDPGYAATSAGVDDPNVFLNVAYVFQVDGKYVARREEVLKEFWHLDSPYGYHTKIELTVMQVCRPEQAQKAIEDFMRAGLPEIEKCLPDWNELNRKSAKP
jgi:hypothetical protein